MIHSKNVFNKLTLVAATAVLGQLAIGGNVSATENYDAVAGKYLNSVAQRVEGKVGSQGYAQAVRLAGDVRVVAASSQPETALAVGVAVDSGRGLQRFSSLLFPLRRPQ